MGVINRYFSREFKINAVQLVTKQKMSVRQAAEELEIEDEKGTWNNQALYIFLYHSH
jgi:transposase-like protein